jgi:phosphomannomutase
VEHEDWWYNVRPSNTEPLLRLNVEARTPERCAARVEEVRALIAAYADPRTDLDPDSADDPEELP